jgi:hypothetical protein
MPRTDAGKIQAICKVKAGDDLTSFISTANNLVNDVCLDSGYNEARLTDIETYLAAHFYKVDKPEASYTQTGMSQKQIESKVDLGLKVTRWGQQAMVLDFKGNLAAIDLTVGPPQNRRVKIGVTWLGTEDC